LTIVPPMSVQNFLCSSRLETLTAIRFEI
jgi:hypothetical protein